MLRATLAALPALLLAAAPAAALPDCEWCGMADAPDSLGWSTVIAPPGEPGERLVVTGTVYGADGTTPAPGVTLYVYHTDATGVYPRRGDERGNGRRHGYLRGWMRTDEAGRYRFETIRPAPYPTHEGEPAHIHMTYQVPGGTEDWVASTWFADDPRVTPEKVAGRERTAGSDAVMAVRRDAAGVWHGRRDLVLPVGSGPPGRRAEAGGDAR